MYDWTWVIWNLFLAAIPVAAGYALGRGAEAYTIRKHRVPWIVWLPLALVWLAFLPNTCYLLTEWRHFLFDNDPGTLAAAANDRLLMLSVAKWALFFLVYSGLGAVTFVLSVRPIERLLRELSVPVLPVAVLFFFLTSLGVYLGLIVRLNSWDLATNPQHVLHVALGAVSHQLLLETIIIFGILLWLMYIVLDMLIDGFVLRWRRRNLMRSVVSDPAPPSN